MRPQTVHALAQLVRHTRGCVTTLEKWVAATPPEAFATEAAEAIALVRVALTEMNTTLGTSRPSAAPLPGSRTVPDRPAVLAARCSVPDGT